MRPEQILELLPPFERATRRRAAEAIAERLRSGAGLAEAGREALARRQRLVSESGTAVERCLRAGPAERIGALRELFAVAAGRELSRKERRDLARGSLGLDALQERCQRELAQLESQALVAFLAADAGAADAIPPDLAQLALALTRDRSWRLAKAAFDAMARRAARGAPVPGEILGCARELAGDYKAAPFTAAAAMALLARAQGAPAAKIIAQRLSPGDGADDIFVRARAVRTLAEADAESARRELPPRRDDPSEHVRIEVARQLARLEQTEALIPMLDPERERSPRVRACAAIAVARLSAPALRKVLESDPHETPRRAALEEAEALAAEDADLRAAIESLATGSPWPELSRLAAEACERIHHRADPQAAKVFDALRSAALSIPEGGQTALRLEAAPEEVGRALAVLSTEDFGLQARRRHRGWSIVRGDRFGRQAWRVLHEMTHPSPDKRQSYPHTVGRLGFGEVRAPPSLMAEVTATKVPGERVLVPKLGDWGRHLPTVDDLLARPRGGELAIFSAHGLTRVSFPSGLRWLRTRAVLTGSYAKLAQLRWQSLVGAELRDRQRYLRELEALGFSLRFEPYRAGPAEVVALYQGGGAAPQTSAMAGVLPAAEALRQWLDPTASTTNHLAAAGLAALGLFFVRLHDARREIDRARESIPLTIAGWGTRGKSGTERLKAGLFQGLGCEVLVKTTGCEAMVIHGVPDQPASEVFIYRTYDKATIWEQRDLLKMAERMEVDVFLWECMALNPSYVEILERRWMRDDFCTLTNTYPDHENIQGPAGVDIPRVMTRFIPPGKTLFTSEEQMFPILRDAAAECGTKIVQVRWRDHALLPQDLLERFPYDEHPRNIALVLKLAEALGIDQDLALKEMADWVVPDLGVLKTYPEARWRGRRLTFSNGMSANERTGFLNNWVRCGFDKHQPDDVGEWIVTVVNNRADRVSRSMVFADIVVDDATAHAQVLIGTNLAGLSGFIRDGLDRVVSELILFHPDEQSLPREKLEELATARARRAFARIKLGELGAQRLALEAEAMARGLEKGAHLEAEVFTEALTLGEPSLEATRVKVKAALESKLAAFADALGEQGREAVAHLLEWTARHAALLALFSRLTKACGEGPEQRAQLERELRELYREIFLATIVPLWDSGLTGDQVVDSIARACPPGFKVRVMGIQNIKGTGLDFAYRWVHFDRTSRLLKELARSKGADAVRVARALASSEGLGVLDLTAAEPAIAQAVAREEGSSAEALRSALSRVQERRKEREAALTGGKGAGRPAFVGPLEKLLDVWDGIWRRWRADRVLDSLVEQRLSHESAARQMRDLMQRQKGGWLLKG